MRLSRVICLLSVALLPPASEGVAQYGLQPSLRPNEISPNFHLYKTVSGPYSVQMNLITVGIIPRDAYNNDQTSASLYPVLSLSAMLALSMIGGDGSEWPTIASTYPESSSTRKTLNAISMGIMIPILLTNSQHYIRLGSRDSASTPGLVPSLFIGLQTDLYKYETSWWRFSPTLGVEIFVPFERTEEREGVKVSGLGFEFGVSKRWDLIYGENDKSATLGYFAVKYSVRM